MSEVELSALLKKEGYLTNFRLKSLCTEEEFQDLCDLLEKMVTQNKIQGFLKDGIVHFKEKTRFLC